MAKTGSVLVIIMANAPEVFPYLEAIKSVKLSGTIQYEFKNYEAAERAFPGLQNVREFWHKQNDWTRFETWDAFEHLANN